MTELGTRLKEARIAKGYSIEDLQEITKIQKDIWRILKKETIQQCQEPFM